MTMAFLLLLSTVSFTVEKHFCGDKLIAVAMFSSVEKCTTEVVGTEHEELIKVPCCKDVLELVSGQNQLNSKPFQNWNVDQQHILAAPISSCSIQFVILEKEKHSQINYHPPNLVTDLQVLDQVFII
jgi:hypothetical protein